MKVRISDEALERILEFYSNATQLHFLDPAAEAAKVWDDIMDNVANLLIVKREPTVKLWRDMGLWQVNSRLTRWCYGILLTKDLLGEDIIYVARAEHQQNMTDKSITMQ